MSLSNTCGDIVCGIPKQLNRSKVARREIVLRVQADREPEKVIGNRRGVSRRIGTIVRHVSVSTVDKRACVFILEKLLKRSCLRHLAVPRATAI